MVALAAHSGEGPVRVDIIAEDQDLSPSYIHVLFGSLKTAGLVRSVRGPHGGYQLARKATDITAYDVISTLEGETVLVECVGEPGTCSRAAACSTRDLWCQIAASVDGVLKGMTLASLAENQCRDGQAPNYCI
jgi:Rrf2 family protein